eukprot:TRINITY_DN66418_c5_g1_i1.p1 TRINITY_DN66418_c5_g1~~TRINITY_DN66418_c5_g1_i1.p1  ORF type:complete len:348 (-),score=55.56 TRINITY_DN66418_c5_g1_i1:400-1314(-)
MKRMVELNQEQMDLFADTPGGKLVAANNRIDELEEELRRRVGIPAEMQTDTIKTHDDDTGLPLSVVSYIKRLEADLYGALDKLKSRICGVCNQKLQLNTATDLQLQRLASEQIRKMQERKAAYNGEPVNPIVNHGIDEADMLKHLCKDDYAFGTRNVCLSRVSDELVVKVGGGYLRYEDFAKRFGKEEAEKMKKAVLAETQRRLNVEDARDKTNPSLTVHTSNPFSPSKSKTENRPPSNSVSSRGSSTSMRSSSSSFGGPGVSPIRQPFSASPTKLNNSSSSNTRQVVPAVVMSNGKPNWKMPK